MEILYVLIPLSLGLLGIAIAIFVWAVRSGQMDDLERPGHSILYEDDEALVPDDAKRPQEDTDNQRGEAAQKPAPEPKHKPGP